MMTRDNILIVASSDHDANMLYAVGMFVPQPFIYLRIKERSYVVLDDLELGRARSLARQCRVVSLNRCQAILRSQGCKSVGPARVIAFLLRQHRVRRVRVPPDFSLTLAEQLQRLGIRVKPSSGPFFPAREFKTAEEVKKISAALMMAEVGLAEGILALRTAKIARNRNLIHHNMPLTSDKLRAIICSAIVQAGGTANHTIVAGGRQACDPHEQGHGVLRAHEPIVINIFPRSQKTGYFGDITRTLVKGRASEGVRKLYATVERGQQIGFDLLRSRTNARAIHKSVQDYFEREGYKTGRTGGRFEGFFHGAGHGLGLEAREAPILSAQSRDRLSVGHVVSVEPGLYYPDLGGIRLEDVALVTRNGPRNLTKFEKTLEV